MSVIKRSLPFLMTFRALIRFLRRHLIPIEEVGSSGSSFCSLGLIQPFPVTFLLKSGKSAREPGIGCAISIDGVNTLICNLNHFANLSHSVIFISVSASHCRRCTVNDPEKLENCNKNKMTIGVRIIKRSLPLSISFRASMDAVNSNRQDKTKKDSCNHHLELVFNWYKCPSPWYIYTQWLRLQRAKVKFPVESEKILKRNFTVFAVFAIFVSFFSQFFLPFWKTKNFFIYKIDPNLIK